MKPTALLLLSASALAFSAQAQTTAMDFNRNDCDGNAQHLFSQLDNNHVAILEFFMLNCGSCVTAGNKLKTLKSSLDAEFPNQIHSYAIAYNNSYDCVDIKNWVTTNNFNMVPMDSGATQLAYYGGFGMPTVVVVAGSSHTILHTAIGFSNSDTTAIGNEVRNFFASLQTNTIGTSATNPMSMRVSPNPARQIINVNMALAQNANVDFQLVNMLGAVVQQWSAMPCATGETIQPLELNNIPTGIYTLKAQSDKLATSQQVVIE